MKALVVVLLAASLCFGQRFPAFQGIQPDTVTGRPVSVATSCAISSESADPTWAVPISVYEDSGISLYIDQDCLNMAADVFSASGEYFVSVYAYYRDSDWPCVRWLPANPTPEQAAKKKEWQAVCKDIVYKAQRLQVDTRTKKYKLTAVNVFDSHGFHLSILGSMKDWRPLDDLVKDPNGQPLRLAIDRTTKLVERESAYWAERRKELQH